MRLSHLLLVPLLHWPLEVAAQSESATAADSTETSADTQSTAGTSASSLARNVEAIQQGNVGLEAFERQQWDTAYLEFQRALALAYSPVFVLFMARAKRNSGELLAADRLYADLEREQLPATAVEAWRLAQNTARTERAELELRLPSIQILLEPASAAQTTVTLDGVELEQIGDEIVLDPGVHRVTARRPGALPSQRSVTLREGDKHVRVVLTLIPTPSAEIAPSPAPKRASTVEPPQPRTQQPPLAAYLTGAVGLTSLVVTAVVGTWAFSEYSKLESKCEGTRCDPADAGKAESIQRLATIADASLVVGLAGVGVSATLFWLSSDSQDSALVRGVQFTGRY